MYFQIPLVILFLFLGADVQGDTGSVSTPSNDLEKRPNFLVILVDDMGYSDLDLYGGDVECPNLTRLAEGGLRWTQFYNTGRCWTTRASLMTGRYPHEAGHAMPWGMKAPAAYRGTDRDRSPMISELLKSPR